MLGSFFRALVVLPPSLLGGRSRQRHLIIAGLQGCGFRFHFQRNLTPGKTRTLHKKREGCDLDKTSAETIKRFRDHIIKQFEGVYIALENEDADLATDILRNSKKDEKTMYKYNTVAINQRIKKGEVHPEIGMLLIDVIYNFQRISYHMRRVLYSILRINQRYDDEKALQIEES